MPKPKPDQVIRHEIVLGKSERELVDTAVTAFAARSVISPLVSLLSDNTALIALFTILEASGVIDVVPNEILQGIKDGVYDSVQAAEEAYMKAQEIANEAENAARLAAGLAPILPVPMAPLVRVGMAAAFIKSELNL